ncbi:MAG: geranylgeranylglyceryl/heptaprenylglyceryl phosphate synthase [Candidatus Hodarchaeales archaeon]|jgi:phosphoglycerol geranylgeranyltransferase
MTWQEFRHITKLDPDKNNTPELINFVSESGTDAIMISGTQGITRENVTDLYKKLRSATDKPICCEPAHKFAIIYDADFIYLPIVLNSQEIKWIVNAHVDWLGDLVKADRDLPWDRVVSEGYIVMNPNSAVAKVTNAKTGLNPDQVATYAIYGQLLGTNAVYIEYSGVYGSIDAVKKTKRFMSKSKLFYGGGISNADQSKEMLNYVETIFVGNILYQNRDAFLSTIPK